MNDSFGQGGFEANSDAKVESKAEGVLSLFVEQIKTCGGDGIRMWGKNYGFVVIVGIVRKIDFQSTKTSYLLEDHTGQINAHLWTDDGDSEHKSDVGLNVYARVYGSIRRQGDEFVIMIYKIEKLGSVQELTTHILEVLHCRYKSEAMFKQKEQSSNMDTGVNSGPNFSLSGATDGANKLGLKGKQLLVYQAIKSHNSIDGIPRHVLQAKFAHFSSNEFQSIMDFLFHEGHVFTSIDSDHFLSTE